MKKSVSLALLSGVVLVGVLVVTAVPGRAESLMWINHLDFLAGDTSVVLSYNANDSGVGGGLAGLIINSNTAGEDADGGGIKVIEKGVPVPPGFLVNGVRVCYELSSGGSYISQIRLSQVMDPPSSAAILLDDGTDLTGMGPVCVDSAVPFSGPIDPTSGALLLALRLYFENPIDPGVSVGDTIVVRGVALSVIPQAADDLQGQIDDLQDDVTGLQDDVTGLQDDVSGLQDDLENHTHNYLTGKGVGHNKVVVESGMANIWEEPPPEVMPLKKPINKMKRPKKKKR